MCFQLGSPCCLWLQEDSGDETEDESDSESDSEDGYSDDRLSGQQRVCSFWAVSCCPLLQPPACVQPISLSAPACFVCTSEKDANPTSCRLVH